MVRQPTITVRFGAQLPIAPRNFREVKDLKAAKRCFGIAAISVHQSASEVMVFRGAALQCDSGLHKSLMKRTCRNSLICNYLIRFD